MNNPDKSTVSQTLEKDDILVKIPKDLIHRLRVFAANSNNHLMGLKVSGNNILSSAEIMIEAMELNTILEKIYNAE